MFGTLECVKSETFRYQTDTPRKTILYSFSRQTLLFHRFSLLPSTKSLFHTDARRVWHRFYTYCESVLPSDLKASTDFRKWSNPVFLRTPCAERRPCRTRLHHFKIPSETCRTPPSLQLTNWKPYSNSFRWILTTILAYRKTKPTLILKWKLSHHLLLLRSTVPVHRQHLAVVTRTIRITTDKRRQHSNSHINNRSL